MNKKTKRFLFLGAVTAFLVLSFIVVMYAQGYKYDFDKGSFSLTGAISIKVSTDSQIFLDDEYIGNTSFFGNSGTIDRLLPGDYTVSLLKEGYSSWQKTISVEEGRVTDFGHILLLPQQGEEKENLILEVETLFGDNLSVTVSPTPKPTPTPRPSPTPKVLPDPGLTDERVIMFQGKLFENIDSREFKEIASNVKGFEVFEDGNKVAWWNNNEIWVIWLSDTNYQPFHKKGDVELITRISSPIVKVLWFRGGDHLVVKFGDRNFRYKVVEIDKRGGVNIVEL